MKFFSCIVLNVIPLKYLLINHQECKIRLEVINVNSNEPLFYPHNVN